MKKWFALVLCLLMLTSTALAADTIDGGADQASAVTIAVGGSYLDAIDAGEAFDPPVQVLTPDPSYQPPRYPDQERRRKLLRRVCYIIIAIDILLILALTVLRALGG